MSKDLLCILQSSISKQFLVAYLICQMQPVQRRAVRQPATFNTSRRAVQYHDLRYIQSVKWAAETKRRLLRCRTAQRIQAKCSKPAKKSDLSERVACGILSV